METNQGVEIKCIICANRLSQYNSIIHQVGAVGAVGGDECRTQVYIIMEITSRVK